MFLQMTKLRLRNCTKTSVLDNRVVLRLVLTILVNDAYLQADMLLCIIGAGVFRSAMLVLH